jgi:hypothetical protein
VRFAGAILVNLSLINPSFFPPVTSAKNPDLIISVSKSHRANLTFHCLDLHRLGHGAGLFVIIRVTGHFHKVAGGRMEDGRLTQVAEHGRRYSMMKHGIIAQY